jgi:hypothetical protein
VTIGITRVVFFWCSENLLKLVVSLVHSRSRSSGLLGTTDIQNKVATHITPGGLADETYDFVNELNSVDHQEKLEQFDLAAWVR